MSFQIHALPMASFTDLFDLGDEALAARSACRVIATSNPGFPCRVSLKDAEIDDELILLNYRHLDANTPYAASHAIYVRRDVPQAHPDPGEVPDVLSRRLLSVRAFTSGNMMKDADVVDGHNVGPTLSAMFENPEIAFIHLHNAKQGCFAAKATRADTT